MSCVFVYVYYCPMYMFTTGTFAYLWEGYVLHIVFVYVYYCLLQPFVYVYYCPMYMFTTATYSMPYAHTYYTVTRCRQDKSALVSRLIYVPYMSYICPSHHEHTQRRLTYSPGSPRAPMKRSHRARLQMRPRCAPGGCRGPRAARLEPVYTQSSARPASCPAAPPRRQRRARGPGRAPAVAGARGGRCPRRARCPAPRLRRQPRPPPPRPPRGAWSGQSWTVRGTSFAHEQTR